MEPNARLFHAKSLLGASAVAAALALAAIGAGAAPPAAADDASPPDRQHAVAARPAASVEEARDRARLLHETIHSTLHVVHHQYYRLDEGLELPAATLKDVFRELADRHKIELRWLVVDGQAMNVAHKPRDKFEEEAAKVLASGQIEHEFSQEGVYRHAGAITLASECLKCHVPNRTSTKPRTAGLVISMPLEKP